MNLRVTVGRTSRWVLLLYLAVVAVTGVAHSCTSVTPESDTAHAAITAAAEAAGAHGCPTCDLHQATVSALVTTSANVVLLPREACQFGESAVSPPTSRALTQLSRGPPSA